MNSNVLQNQLNQQSNQSNQPILNRQAPISGQTQPQASVPDANESNKPYAAYPATMKRDFDPAIYNMISTLVDKKYGAEINPQAREFEISRVYNKLEIEIFERSTFQLPPEKRVELQKLTEEAQNPNIDQQDIIKKIKEYMQYNVPNIDNMVKEYMNGFNNQYIAGRY